MQWGQAQPSGQDVYNRYNPYPMPAGGYPNVTASGTPVNYGAYFPPTTISSSPAYSAASGVPNMYPGAMPVGYYAHPGGHGGGQHSQVPGTSTHNGTQSSNTGPSSTGSLHGNGYRAANTSSPHTSYDASLVNALQNMSFNK